MRGRGATSRADGAPPANGATTRMPVGAHLRELRIRSVRIAVAAGVGLLAGFLLSDAVLDLLRAPIAQLAESRNATLNYASVSGAFDLKMQIAVYSAGAIAAPVLLWQAVAFMSPGLTRRERRWTIGFASAALPLFAAGCLVGVWMFPHIVQLLAGFASTEDSTVLDAERYVEFVLKLAVAFGVAFVSPVFVVLLNAIGVLPGRSIVRGWRVVIVGVVLFCAVATPAADIGSMFLLAVPMCLLFAAAAGVAVLHDRAVARRVVARLEEGVPLEATPRVLQEETS